MAPLIDRGQLLAAWRALSGGSLREGWRTIGIAGNGPCPALAGRYFPGNAEAVLIGFSAARVPAAQELPSGRGFLVTRTEHPDQDGVTRAWIALCRQSAGNLDLFAMMAEDVLATLPTTSAGSEDKVLQGLLTRIRAWQEFMQRGQDLVLSPEEESGLFGELAFLSDLLDAGLDKVATVNAWTGPLDAIHDFRFGTGAFEVKTTLAASGFIAEIGSLEQLDDSLTQPLFLTAMCLALTPSGITLTEQVHRVRQSLSADAAALDLLDARLLRAGFVDLVAASYTRRFTRVGRALIPVTDTMPRLTRTKVPLEISWAKYELMLNMPYPGSVELPAALSELGVA